MINQQTLPNAILFLRCCYSLRKFRFQYITSYRSIAQTALVAIQVASLKSNGIWTTGGYSGIAQTVLVAMPAVCPPLQISAAAELATCIFSQRSFRHGRTLRLGRAL